MTKYQVVFFGNADIAIPSLHALSESAEISVNMVVTQPDMPVGRHQELRASPIKQYAQTINIPVLQPEKIRGNKDFLQLIRELKPDLFVVEAYGKILPKELLDIPKYGAINIHISLLPKYRGASPVQQALLNGDKESGVTIMKISEKMDEGDIILLKKIAIAEDDNQETLTKKLAILGGGLIEVALLDYIHGETAPIPQDHSKATHCQKIEKEDGRIRWGQWSAEEIHNRIRAFTPWPSCYTTWEGKRLKILEAKTESGIQDPGEVSLSGDTMKIGTKNGLLVPTKLQLEGKNITDVKTFLHGNRRRLVDSPMLK